MNDALRAIISAADAGCPMRPKDLMRFEPADVRRLFDDGEIIKAPLRNGAEREIAILPAPIIEADDDAWSDDELNYLRLAYPAGVSFGELSRSLQRTGGEILQQAWRLDLGRPLRDMAAWGQEVPAWRIRRLRAMLHEAEARGCNLLDDGEDIQGHRALARRFAMGRASARDRGRHGDRWTADEIARLRTLREQGASAADIARALGRTLGGAVSKLSELRLVVDQRWTEDEDRILITGLDRGMTIKDVAAMLPGRSALAVKQRGYVLVPGRGFDRWEPEEIYALRLAVERGENLRQFAVGIGRTKCGVRWQCQTLGLVHPKAVCPYTEQEDRRIREGWKRKDRPQDIAADLGRPIAGIYNRAFKLGITGRGPGRYHGPRVRRFEIDYIRIRVEQGWPAKQIAERIHRSHHMVYQIAKKNGIRFPQCGRRRAAA